jgi:hypothetical protein
MLLIEVSYKILTSPSTFEKGIKRSGAKICDSFEKGIKRSGAKICDSFEKSIFKKGIKRSEAEPNLVIPLRPHLINVLRA